MLRTALKILLALVLVLNGFAMPVAMAAHADALAAADHLANEAPCHAGMADADMPQAGTQAQSLDGNGKSVPGKHSSSCCVNGHCVCGCFVSTTAPLANPVVFAFAAVRSLVANSVALPSARYAVALRPPIA